VRLTKFTRNTVVEDLYQKPLSALSDGEKDTLNPLLKPASMQGRVQYRGTAGSLSCCIATEEMHLRRGFSLVRIPRQPWLCRPQYGFPCQDAAYIGDCPGPSQSVWAIAWAIYTSCCITHRPSICGYESHCLGRSQRRWANFDSMGISRTALPAPLSAWTRHRAMGARRGELRRPSPHDRREQ